MIQIKKNNQKYSVAQILHSKMAHSSSIKDEITVRSYPLNFSKVRLVRAETKKAKTLWNKIIAKYHYLGYTGTVGRYIRYFICDCSKFDIIQKNNEEISDVFHEFVNTYTSKELEELLGLERHETNEKHNIETLPKSHLSAYLRFGWWFKKNSFNKIENIKHLFRPIIGCISAGSATYSSQPRDFVLGISHLSKKERDKYLKYIANNWRFLILGRWPNLASRVLSEFSKAVQNDWIIKYQNPLIAIESFVMKDRFDGASYTANRWIKIGETKGYSKAGSISKNSLIIYGHGEKKSIYLKLLFKFQTNNDVLLQQIKKRNRQIMQRLSKGENLINIMDTLPEINF